MNNALTFITDLGVFKKSGITSVTVAALDKALIKNTGNLDVTFFKDITFGAPASDDENIFLSDLEVNEKILDYAIEHKLKNKTQFMARACGTLEEVGRFDVKYGLSPIMFLNKLGLLSGAKIAGGIYLDNDDVSLMVQENASLILTPSYDFGRGGGIPNTVSYLRRGLKISVGIADLKYNETADLKFELKLLKLITSAHLCKEDALKDEELFRFVKQAK